MSDPKDKLAVQASGVDKRSGRAAFDERGNSVWEWQLETGVYSRDVSTQRLKKLEFGDLSLADTAIQQRPPGLGGGKDKEKERKSDGFDPYDNASRRGGFDPYDTAAARKRANPAAGPSKPKRTPEEIRKLDEFLKMKRRLQEQKEEEDE